MSPMDFEISINLGKTRIFTIAIQSLIVFEPLGPYFSLNILDKFSQKFTLGLLIAIVTSVL